ncbi:MAG: rod shape-determining protein MreC [Pseudomonadota bacterium]
MAQRRSARRDEEGVRFSRTFLFLLIVISIILIVNDRPETRNPALAQSRAVVNDTLAPLLDLAAQPVRGMRNIGPWWRRQLELAQENRDLREEISELAAWRDVALTLRDRAQIYEQALNLSTPASRERISAWTVADRDGPFVRARLVDVGAEDGVRAGYPAVNVYGLVGRVVDSGQRSSRILLLNDLNSRIAVMSDRSNTRALLVGDNSEFPRLEYLGREPDMRVGDRIITSGDDNEMPRGLPVGEAVQDADGTWRVALFSRSAPVDLIWIWPFDPVVAPDEAPVIEPGPDEAELALTDEPVEPAASETTDSETVNGEEG